MPLTLDIFEPQDFDLSKFKIYFDFLVSCVETKQKKFKTKITEKMITLLSCWHSTSAPSISSLAAFL